jgi:hypothetical protein
MSSTTDRPRRAPRSSRSPVTKGTRSILRTKSHEESLYATIIRDEQPRIRRNVSFDTTEIRSYPRVFDKSQEGPALSIGWKPLSTEVTTVMERELERTSRRGEVRPLKLEQRVDILLNAGYQKKEIINHLLAGVKPVQVASSKPKNKNVADKLMKMASKFAVSA